MFNGIWTGIVFLFAMAAVFVWQGQGITMQGESAILSIPDLSFRILAKAIDTAVPSAVIWEIGADMLARITSDRFRREGRQEGRQEIQREIQDTIARLKSQGVPADQILNAIASGGKGDEFGTVDRK